MAYDKIISPRDYRQVMHFKEKILKPYFSNNKYVTISLCKNGKRKLFLIHRLVAETFIPNPDNLPVINHKDENKWNNRVNNLEWCDQSYNINYGNGAISRKNSIRTKYGKKICQYNKNGNLIDILETAHDKEPEFSATKIIACCKNKRKTYKSFIWKYYDEKGGVTRK